MIEMLIGTVKYILITLGSGQSVVRNKAVLRKEMDKTFVNSHQAEKVKILLNDSEELNTNEKFAIVVSSKENIDLPQKFIIQIGDLIVEVEKISQFELEVRRILKGGFVKSGNKVSIVKF
jgi:uncharacterized protein YcsI (UPF0317 family)